MIINIHCNYNENRAGLIKEMINIEVDPKQTIEDIIALLSVQNSNFDFDKCKIKLNGIDLPRKKTVKELKIDQECILEAYENSSNASCCLIF
jgi:endonuclease YncB( thermonuclease family)